jgi:hypothetical protein
MRPTDVCHPNDLRAPASRAFPASDRDFHRVDTPQSLRLCAVLPGDQTVHAVRTASADCPSHNTDAVRIQCLPRAFCLTAFRTRAWAFSSHGARSNRASDIPCRVSPFIPTCSSPSCEPVRPSSCWACVRIVVMGKPPSLPSTPTRDGWRFQQTRMPSLGKDPS